MIPNFFLVGAPKAGTTSLYDYLSQHPSIFVPEIKEPNHFCKVGPQKRNVTIITDPKKYANLYKKAKSTQLKGDFSVSYLHDTEAPVKIKEANRDAKIIIVIRDPILRAYSHWLMDRREGFSTKKFTEAFIEDYKYSGERGFCYNSMYYDCGLYLNAIKSYTEKFKSVLILVYEELFLNIEDSMQRIFSFLEIPPIAIQHTKRLNESGEIANPFLKRIYHSAIVRPVVKKIFGNSLKQKIRGKIIIKTDDKITDLEYKTMIPYFHDDVIGVRKLINREDLWPSIQ
jgi:hypothetical protein